MSWLSEHYFFRDPIRPIYSDTSYFFPPADGIILYVQYVSSDEGIIDIKGKSYNLKTAMCQDSFNKFSLVIGIFMIFYDVHINRVPYAGYLSYQEPEAIDG